MADPMTSGEDQRQVAVTIYSSTTSTAGTKLAPLEPQEDLMHKLLKERDDLDREEHSPEAPLIKKIAAEFIGTFVLMFMVQSSIVREAQHRCVLSFLGVAALTVLTGSILTGVVVHISGSHLNPAVSLAMAALGHLPWTHLLPYAAAQTVASAAAAFLAKAMYHPAPPDVMATVPPPGHIATAFAIELVLTFILVFAITAGATHPTRSKELVVNITLVAAIFLNNWPSTGPSMNPARTLGAALVTGKYTDIWMYMVAPPLGAIAGASAYTLIKPCMTGRACHLTK